jgi:ABC-type transporter Mla maintaining outer membrane lipid asymmetry permease subunit MlaE
MASLSNYCAENLDAFILAIKKILAWLLPSVLGVSTKLAYESRKKRVHRSRIVTSFIMAVFVGYMCDIICTHYGWADLRGVIVAIGALSSETLVQYTLENVSRTNITAALKRLFNLK